MYNVEFAQMRSKTMTIFFFFRHYEDFEKRIPKEEMVQLQVCFPSKSDGQYFNLDFTFIKHQQIILRSSRNTNAAEFS